MELSTVVVVGRESAWASNNASRWWWNFRIETPNLTLSAGNDGYVTRFGAHRAARRLAEQLGITVKRIDEE